jgi:hypothetical protein
MARTQKSKRGLTSRSIPTSKRNCRDLRKISTKAGVRPVHGLVNEIDLSKGDDP